MEDKINNIEIIYSDDHDALHNLIDDFIEYMVQVCKTEGKESNG